ncbi:glycosyl hydrolase family 5 [Thioclava sp. BHET1]|nr:glycosyl hydrolase family 5 [Thioclava sp. BHET1]
MRRRDLLASLPVLTLAAREMFAAQSAAAASAAPDPQAAADWARWKAAFLDPSGRVVDRLQSDVSHSEGQSYGLLLAEAFNEPETFALIHGWTEHNLRIRQDELMAWRWFPDRSHAVPDWHNATDGDLMRAWALMRAGRRFGRRDYLELARAAVADLVTLCLAPDPRAPGQQILMPSAEGFRPKGGLVVNPSYIMARPMKELGLFAGQPALLAAADHGLMLLSELAAGGLVPDWVALSAAGLGPAEGFDWRYGYDALRVPLFLIWSGLRAHPAVGWVAEMDRRFGRADQVPVEIGPGPVLRAESNSPGYRALARFVTCQPEAGTAPAQAAANPYYPASLGLLVRVAGWESGASCG